MTVQEVDGDRPGAGHELPIELPKELNTSDNDPDDVLSVFEFWCERRSAVLGSTRKPKPTQKRLLKVRSRLRDGHTVDDLLDGHLVPFVEGVGRVTPDASQVAAGEPNEDARLPRQGRLALDRVKDLVDSEHVQAILPRPGDNARHPAATN